MYFLFSLLILFVFPFSSLWRFIYTCHTCACPVCPILSCLCVQYVVILDSIPQVGYLTDFDKWIFSNFVMLSLCVFCHQVVVNSQRKVGKWPFRAVIIRIIELTGRIVVIPLSVYLFTETFDDDDIKDELRIMMFVFFCLFALVCIREFYGVRKSIKEAMQCITAKVDLGELPCSWVELGAINLYYFRVIDFTTIPYEAKKKRMKRAQADNSSTSEGPVKMKASVRRSRQRSLLGRVMRRGSTYDSDDEDEDDTL